MRADASGRGGEIREARCQPGAYARGRWLAVRAVIVLAGLLWLRWGRLAADLERLAAVWRVSRAYAGALPPLSEPLELLLLGSGLIYLASLLRRPASAGSTTVPVSEESARP